MQNAFGSIVLAGLAGLALAMFLWRRFLTALARRNIADWGRPWLNRLDGFNRILCRRFHRLHHPPLELPAQGAVLVVANHVSGLDPLLMIAASPRPLRFIIAREQYDRWFLRWLFRAIGCIPIGRRGGHRDALAAARRALAAGEVVALFPQGGITPDDDAATPLKPGIALLAAETGVPVHVLRLEGIRGRGRTLTAVLLRSRARIHPRGILRCEPNAIGAFLHELARRLATPVGSAVEVQLESQMQSPIEFGAQSGTEPLASETEA